MKQRALMAALEKHEVVFVVPDDVNHSEAVSLGRAARGLARRGLARAIYVRRLDRLGRYSGHLALTSVDSMLCGDAYRLGSPSWVDPSLGRLWESLSGELQAAVLEHVTGRAVSPRTAARIAREMREREAAA